MKKLAAVLFALLLAVPVSARGFWAEEYISRLADAGVKIYDAERDTPVTRGEFCEYIVRVMKIPPESAALPFRDAAAAGTHTPYISAAVRLGIVSGFSDGTFRPRANLTREEAVVMLSRAFGFLAGYSAKDSFPDFSEVSDQAKSAVSYACRKGIISGYPDGFLRIKNNVTHAEAAAMLAKAGDIETVGEPGFVIGYPRLSAKGLYGCISVDVVTNMPCVVYYTLRSADDFRAVSPESVNTPLVTVTGANRTVSETIVCDVGEAYNVYLTAVAADGRRSRTVCIENTTALPYTEGDGTKQSPYGIYNEQQLSAVRYFSSAAFSVKQDIRLSGEWTPIEDFTGVFDGCGHRISGVRVDSRSSGGLFKRISRGEVKNLTVDARIKAHKNAGVIAGEIGDAKITACAATGTVSAATNNAGGLFGESAGTVDNCLSAVYVVEAGSFAGGIAGQNYGTIKNSISAAHSVSADMYAGGIAAINSGGKIERCVSADINVFDYMMNNCGRIAVNKKEGITNSNFALDTMNTTSDTDVRESDNRNGADISWEELCDRRRLCAAAGLDETLWTSCEEYRIMYPKGAAAPQLLEGICEYAPVRISSAAELLGIIQNPDRHYILTRDIYFDEHLPWTPAGTGDGFSGSLDGNGCTIFNLRPEPMKDGVCAMFEKIAENGTVRSLRLYNTRVSGELCGAFAGENRGTITGCSADALSVAYNGAGVYAGGICGENFGIVRGCSVSGEMKLSAANTVAGGICAHNEGLVEQCSFSGGISAVKENGVSEAVSGGICGYSSDAMIYESYSSANISQTATTMYTGGICAILSGGDIYKCSSRGKVTSAPPRHVGAKAYTGGVCALASGAVVINSFSAADITSYSAAGYTGGVCGYNESANIQTTYAAGRVVHTYDATFDMQESVYAGGVCGYNEAGTIERNMALCPEVKSGGSVGRICAGGDGALLYSNFALADMRIAGGAPGAFAGADTSAQRISAGFYRIPVADGGLLGWSDDIWQRTAGYPYPVLTRVAWQQNFSG